MPLGDAAALRRELAPARVARGTGAATRREPALVRLVLGVAVVRDQQARALDLLQGERVGGLDRPIAAESAADLGLVPADRGTERQNVRNDRTLG